MTLVLRGITLNEEPMSQPLIGRFDERGGSVGRSDDATLTLPDPERMISRLQAQILHRDGHYWMENVSAATPILHNGRPLSAGMRVVLEDDDEIRIGGYALQATFEDDEASATILRGRTLVPPFRSSAQTELLPPPAPAEEFPRKPVETPRNAEASGNLADPRRFAEKPGSPADLRRFAESPASPADPRRFAEKPASPADPRRFAESLASPADPSRFAEKPASPADPRRFAESPASPADPRRFAESLASPADPRRFAKGPANLADPRRLAEGPANPADPRRLAESPASPADPRRLAESAANPADPRRHVDPASTLAEPLRMSQPYQRAPDAQTDTTAGSLWRSFLEGAGIELTLPNGPSPQLLGAIGEMMKIAVGGIQRLVTMRARAKSEMHADMTMIQARDNNPLKFSQDPAMALQMLLQPPTRGFLPGPAALRDALGDLQSHQVGMTAGMRAVLEAVLDRLDPAKLEALPVKRSALDWLRPGRREAELWELHLKQYQSLREEAYDNFQRFFGEAFREAYEAQVRNLDATDDPRAPEGPKAAP
jgi:FHA domain-containing protein